MGNEAREPDSPRLSALRREVEQLKADDTEFRPSRTLESQPSLPSLEGATGLALGIKDWSLAEVDRRMASFWAPVDDDVVQPEDGRASGNAADAADVERGIDELLAELDKI